MYKTNGELPLNIDVKKTWAETKAAMDAQDTKRKKIAALKHKLGDLWKLMDEKSQNELVETMRIDLGQLMIDDLILNNTIEVIDDG